MTFTSPSRTALKYSAILSGALFTALLASQVEAQVVERHLPSVPQSAPAQIVAPNAVPADQDATPIGPALRSIVVLSARDAVHASAGNGVDLSSDTRLKGDARTSSDLSAYLGKPLSRKLIAEIEATLAKHYRAAGYPFVSLSTPEQEITSGVLQIRAVEFVAGDISAKGTDAATASYLTSHVALAKGQAVNTRSLGNDLAWLNRYPFRQVQAVFSPGKAPGTTDLSLNASQGKAWQVYTGYSNAGSPATGEDRYYAGAVVGNLAGRDSVLSYQATGSRDAVSGKSHAHYASQALNYVLPVARHAQFEASADQVETNQAIAPFAVRLKAAEAYAGYRFGVSDFYGDTGMTDLRFGIEAKRQTVTTLFSGVNVYDVSMNVYQLLLGYHHASPTANGFADLDVALHMSPGNIDSGNSAKQVALFSQGQMRDATYSYLTVDYDRTRRLSNDYTLKTQITGLFASRALPRTEQAALGGVGQVRGYTLDDGAYDAALVVRNEVRKSVMAVAKSGAVSLSPYAFVDIGHGRDNAGKISRTLASTGVGADMRLTPHASLNLDAAYALTKGAATKSGDTRVEASLNFRF